MLIEFVNKAVEGNFVNNGKLMLVDYSIKLDTKL